MKLSYRIWPCLICLCLRPGAQAGAQTPISAETREPDLTWTTNSAQPQRFVAVHGEQAAVMGYPETGLEIWAYPLQLLSDYRVSFREAGVMTALSGLALLRRVEYHPEEIVRVYVGPDFIVHEHLFVPLDKPGAIVTYEVEGRPDVAIEVGFHPSLNLMWPAALGGQSMQWDDSLPGYVEREPLYGFSAAIASPESAAHDDIINRTLPLQSATTLVLKPKPAAAGMKIATLYVGYDPPGASAAQRTVTFLEAEEDRLRAQAASHDRKLLETSLRIHTPDVEVNRALAWAELALEQAWVCNRMLGCGEVAGYGPSRMGRRPQYDWFFAGDGLVAVDGLLAAGEYSRARDELAFITKYQNKSNGMIWHELSQSAGLIDWEHKYPYMYVHVDITFRYLAAFANYVSITGDADFLRSYWSNIEAAYRYCRSLIRADTGLPQIPSGREGMNEQDRMRDDLGLSSAWIAAAEGFAQMARMAGRAQEAGQAEHAADFARTVIAANDWDAGRHFWLGGHTINGTAVHDERPGPSGVLLQGVFPQNRVDQVLDRIASPEFQTDWGTRSMSASSPSFDPNAYSKGSVSALGSAIIADTFWQEHRPLTAWGIWSSLLAWNTLDSEGHMHEVLAGDFFHPEVESVPEQTWSSAGYLSSAVHGLLGLEVRSADRRLTLAPHLPAQWNEISAGNIRVGNSLLHIHLTRNERGMDLEVENTGGAATVDFAPEIPLGAALTGSAVNTGPARAILEQHAADEHARLRFTAQHGTTHCHIGYSGGVLLAVAASEPQIGDASKNIKMVDAKLANDALTIDAYVQSPGDTSLALVTSWKPTAVEGGSVESQAENRYTVFFDTGGARITEAGGYLRVHAVIHFAQAGR